MGYNERRMMPLLQEPITKEQFERELLNLRPKEADSRREFWPCVKRCRRWRTPSARRPTGLLNLSKRCSNIHPKNGPRPGGNYAIGCSSIWASSSASQGQAGSKQSGLEGISEPPSLFWRNLCFRQPGISPIETDPPTPLPIGHCPAWDDPGRMPNAGPLNRTHRPTMNCSFG